MNEDVIMKKCTKCGVEKVLMEFSVRYKKTGRLHTWCKACVKANNQKWNKNNAEQASANKRKWDLNNPEKKKASAKKTYLKSGGSGQKKWRAKNPNYNVEYYEKNKEKIKEDVAMYRKLNHEKVIAVNKAWRNNNKDYAKLRKKSDINFKIKKHLSERLWKLIKHSNGVKKHSTSTLTGCSVSELIAHMESRFQPGMSWDNYGIYGWHIDHVIPCSMFDLSKVEEQKICFNYLNLQPLWAKDNLEKSGANKKDYTKEKEQFIMVLRALGEI